jgi:VanZ like family
MPEVRFVILSFAISRVAGFVGVLVIIVLSLLPGAERPHTGLPGMAEHFIAYCLTASALAFGFRSMVSRVAIAFSLALLAASMEILQLWVPGRSSEIIDVFAGGLGGLFGVVLGGSLPNLAANVCERAP